MSRARQAPALSSIDMVRKTIFSLGVISLAVVGCGGGSGTPKKDGGGGAQDGGKDHPTSTADGSPDGRSDGSTQPDGGTRQAYALTVTAVDTTFATEDHFIAAVEMQLSGEPFAEAMGRDLGGYSRDYACQDAGCQASVYTDPSSADGGTVVDLPGFGSAVESYEYSKQPMNNIAFESGAGTSLLFGPVLNPTGATGADALALAGTWFAHMASGSNATGRFVQPISAATPLGWPGLWPVLQPFASWNPAIAPTNNAGTCNLTSDDNRGPHAGLFSDDYECDYTTLNLPERDAQVTKTIGPGSSGWTDWKEALWTLNYLQVMHNVKEASVDSVYVGDLDQVGVPGNAVPGNILPGTYLGSSDVEGFQAGNFIQMLDNQAAQWLLQLTTTDGAALSGFASLADALNYSPTAAARWFPASIGVTESADASGFPRPSAYAISAGGSHLLDLAGLLGAYASVYALTDQANAAVGGSQPAQVYFDGDPFPVQNQTPNGSATLHDRALGMIRVAVVNMDRFHVDPTSGLFVDDAALAGGTLGPGTSLSADVAAYTLLSLRTARRALDSQLTLYANTSPDTQGIPSPLDSFAQVDGVTFAARLDALITGLSNTFYDKLTTATGVAYAGWDVAGGKATDAGASLDAHSAAVRGLLVAYLATGQTKFRDRATQVFAHLDATFYDAGARIYRPTAGDTSSTVTFTPRRFGLLQGALRDTYELIATLPGQDALAARVLDRVGRLDKLVLNGWDDRNENQIVDWPGECAQLGTGPDGQPMGKGALQMAERTLSGETGSLAPFTPDAGDRVITTDREHDCVPEISAAKLPSALANSVTFTLTPR
ncbi:MAG TPA: hypothetical protein VKZ18_15310 [Polyangia bacterium]|nr:hypothetical protein [Polyangia bacterium]